MGYVEDAFEARTKYGKRRVLARRGRVGETDGFGDIRLEESAVTVPNLSRHIVQLRQMQYRLGYFLS